MECRATEEKRKDTTSFSPSCWEITVKGKSPCAESTHRIFKFSDER